MARPIAVSPNTSCQDIRLALRMIFQPWRWQRGSALKELSRALSKIIGIERVWLFNSGRSALLTGLKALGVGAGDEVIIQAFTCVAVPDPILWAGAKPVYADIGEGTFNIDPRAIEQRVTKHTKAIVVQHTFGQPAALEEIAAMAKKYKLLLIEDCAHALGGSYQNKALGSFGDISFFSFGRDKVISSVYGGALATHRTDIARRIERQYKAVRMPSRRWTLQQLLHPVVFAVLLPIYGFRLTRAFIWLCQRLGLISLAIQPIEYRGGKPAAFPRRCPNALATLALAQLGRLPQFTAHRAELLSLYRQALSHTSFALPSGPGPWLRLPVRWPNSQGIIHDAWRAGFWLGDWYTNVVAPPVTSLQAVGYQPGQCPRAEAYGKSTFNLPMHPTFPLTDARRLCDWLTTYEAQHDHSNSK